ncbi:LAFE_0F11122g1_1 [Lachancea fermentati]|uniref:DNA polymerase n=1 Tax=Lachancea fermentati TaxID=4955 RepID=A0A1G4MFF7_LACFM|nr:LAFE_0F11122g1_1 [Lachancea fermentati]
MGIFTGYDFLLIPSQAPARVKFFVQLIESNGGNVVDDYNSATYVLVNDTFVDEKGHLKHLDVFHSEWEYDENIWADIMASKNTHCYKMSWVSECIRRKRLILDERASLKILWGNENIDIESNNDSETSTVDLPVGSEDDTDIGSQVSEEPSVGSLPNLEKEAKNATDLIVNNPNADLINALEHLASKYRLKGDTFRSRSYQMAQQSIRKYGKRIHDEKEALSIPNVGTSIAKKIQIILETGQLPGLQESRVLEQELEYFMNCHGVGAHIARKWCVLGAKTFESALKRSPADFHWTVLFGWCYYEDWLARIPRKECELHLAYIQEVLREVDIDARIELTGSYRRGLNDCGDIDTVLYKPGCDDMQELSRILEQMIKMMYESGYILCPLNMNEQLSEIFINLIEQTLTQAGLDSHFLLTTKETLHRFYFGGRLLNSSYCSPIEAVDRLKPEDGYMSRSNSQRRCRRVDILLCKWSELGSTMIYFTGNDDFNKSLRLRATKKGWKLNHHGLFNVGPEDSNGVKKMTTIESFDEKRIMELLGVKFVSPEQRNIEGYI